MGSLERMLVILLSVAVPLATTFLGKALGFLFGTEIPGNDIIMLISDNAGKIIDIHEAASLLVILGCLGKILDDLIEVHDTENGVDETITHSFIHEIAHLTESVDVDVIGTESEVVNVVLHNTMC